MPGKPARFSLKGTARRLKVKPKNLADLARLQKESAQAGLATKKKYKSKTERPQLRRRGAPPE